MAYVCFILDAFSRMIVGWRVAGHMRTPMVLDAIEMAHDLRCQSDAGSQTGLKGSSPHHRSARSAIRSTTRSPKRSTGYYMTELIRGPARTGPWKTIEKVELATLGWVHRHNTQRLHGYLDDLPPAEFEQRFYATPPGRQGTGLNTKRQSLHQP